MSEAPFTSSISFRIWDIRYREAESDLSEVIMSDHAYRQFRALHGKDALLPVAFVCRR